ncbi:MAG: hypothetical protein GY699_01230 [Desulfobacteraceae bacterium]|nr:hypothetical protein [Desulfobacteraceae bacterium]
MKQTLFSVFLYFFVFVTGAAGLMYQVAWQKYLSRLLGSDSIAIAIILGTFLGGLSLGYYLCGKFTTRVKNHFLMYAFLEALIGIWGVFFPGLFLLLDSLTGSWSFSPPVLMTVQGFFCSAMLMGIPTICMGGTVPFLTRAVSQTLAESTHVHAKIYAINTTGAFIGTLLAGFFLIPYIGLPPTIYCAAGLNLSAFFFFYFIGQTLPHGIPSSEKSLPFPDSANAPEKQRRPNSLYIIAFLSGCYVMTMENVLIRLTNFSLGSSSYSFSIIVAVFILAIAIGSYGAGLLKRLPKSLLYTNQLCITLALVAIYFTLDSWPYWAHLTRISFQPNDAGFWLYHLTIFLILNVILMLPVAFMGATVPLTFHELKRDLRNVGKHSGYVFSWNTFGNLAGSLFGGIALFYIWDIERVYIFAVLLASLSTLLAGFSLTKKHIFIALALNFAVILMLITTPFYTQRNFMTGTFRNRTPIPCSFTGPTEFFSKFNAKKKMLYYNDGPTASIAVIESEFPESTEAYTRSRAIFTNGKSDSDTFGDIYTLKLSAHLPVLFSKKRDNALVIGLGTGVTAGELSLYRDVKSIDIAEISPSVVDALPYFADYTNNVHEDPRVQIHIGDAFRVLRRSGKTWDIIISEPSNPWVTGVDLLFTREFYALTKKHLSSSGVLLQWLQTYAASPAMVGTIMNSVLQEFTQLRVFQARPGDMLILAANRPFTQADLLRADSLLTTNRKVHSSLAEINLASVDSILLREVWTPTHVRDHFSSFPIQTFDYPFLHYLAGRDFFKDSRTPKNYNQITAKYADEYLMASLHENWRDFDFSQSHADRLLLASMEKSFHLKNEQPTVTSVSLKLKGFLAYPERFPLSTEDQIFYDTKLMASIMTDNKGRERILSPEESYRELGQKMANHIQRFRNWLVPYPVAGFIALLEEGVEQGKDVYEKNWCALMLAEFILQRPGNDKMIRALQKKIVRDETGTVLLFDRDRPLLKAVNAIAVLQGMQPFEQS